MNAYNVFLIIFIFALSILLFIGGPDHVASRSVKAIWNLGHLVFFATLPLLIYSLTSLQKRKTSIQIVFLLAITLVLGTVVEIFQYGLSRSADLADIYRNLLGVMIAIVFFLPTRNFVSGAWRLMLKIFVIVLLAIQLVPVAIALTDEQQARSSFPILSDFETRFQLSRWESSAVIGIETIDYLTGNRAMSMDLTIAQFSGANLLYFPGEWESYEWLAFNVFNPSTEPLAITCRIHDRKHTQMYQDRFNKSYEIAPGWNDITINLEEVTQSPDNRQMDLNQISGFGIFSSSLLQPRKILIDNLRLF
jgi:VanZ family protein